MASAYLARAGKSYRVAVALKASSISIHGAGPFTRAWVILASVTRVGGVTWFVIGISSALKAAWRLRAGARAMQNLVHLLHQLPLGFHVHLLLSGVASRLLAVVSRWHPSFKSSAADGLLVS